MMSSYTPCPGTTRRPPSQSTWSLTMVVLPTTDRTKCVTAPIFSGSTLAVRASVHFSSVRYVRQSSKLTSLIC